MSATTTAVQEYDAIVKTIQQYIAGGHSGKGSEMKPAFYPDATIFGYVEWRKPARPVGKHCGGGRLTSNRVAGGWLV